MHQGHVLAVRIQRSVVLLCFHSAQHNGILEIHSTKRDWFEKGAEKELIGKIRGIGFISMQSRGSCPEKEVWLIITGQACQPFDQRSEVCVRNSENPVIVYKK